MKYIHYCDNPKLYINWKSKWNTPCGIHAYHKTFADEKEKKSDLYFGMDRKYKVYLDIDTSNVLNLNDYKLKRNDMAKLNLLCNKLKLDFDSIQKNSFRNPKYNNDAGILWSIMYNLLDNYFDYNSFDKDEEEISDGWVIAKNNKPAISWNKLIRWLGYECVIDNGLGIIHEHEPWQSLFLTMSSFKINNVVKRI